MKYILSFFLFFSSSTIMAAPAEVTHIVFCWLKDKGNADKIEKVIRVSKELEIIESLDKIIVGRALPSDRNVVDDSFDIGMVMSFRDQQALNEYLPHKEHVKRVNEVLAPECSKVLIYDIEHDH